MQENFGSLVMAPMAGYTDSPFRQVLRNYTKNLLFTEMVSAEGLVRKNKKSKDLLRFASQERPLGVQIFGSDPDILAEAAVIVEAQGIDLVDLNLGCPATKVCQNGAGATLLPEVDKINLIAKTMARKIKIPFSAKIRLGWNNEQKNYLEVVKALIDGGVNLITVHGRTKVQGYQGEADWEAIKEVQKISSVPVIGNGNIFSYQDYIQRLEESGCAAIMVARGAIGNPWIFSNKKPKLAEIQNQILEHLDLMLDHYGQVGLILMRKHLAKYIHNFKNASKVRVKILSAQTKKEVGEILKELE